MKRIFLVMYAALIMGSSVSGAASASVLYTYTGTIDTLTYNNVIPNSVLIPFSLHEPVFAEIFVPDFTDGTFSVQWPQLFINNVPEPVDGFFGLIQFGAVAGQNTIQMSVPDVTRAATGTFPGSGGLSIADADFCCQFGSPFGAPVENGQALFGGNSFSAVYLPTGQTNTNVRVTGSGSWEAQLIPEPGSLALLGAAVAALGVTRRPRRSLSAR